MVDWVHRNTTSLWPRVALDSELMLSTRRLCKYGQRMRFHSSSWAIHTHKRLVGSSTSSNDTDHSTDAARDNLLGAGWELDTGLALIWVVPNDGDIVSGSTSKGTTVANLLLDVGDNGTFRDLADWENVSDGQSSVLPSVDELAGVHALVGDESLGMELESVWVAKDDLGKWCTTSWVVNDIFYDATNVSMTLSIIEVSELSWSLSQAGRRGEN
jgi:hypothetical protein